MRTLSIITCLSSLLVTFSVVAGPLSDKTIRRQEFPGSKDLMLQGLGTNKAPDERTWSYPASGQLTEKDLQDIKARIEKAALRASGGTDTGGGTIVKTEHGFELLDLYLSESKESRNDLQIANQDFETRAFQNLGIELIKNAQNSIFQEAIHQVKMWQASSPILAANMVRALENMAFYYIKGSFQKPALGYYLPESSNLSSSSLNMVAFYKKGLGSYIGLDDLRQIPRRHQVALFIHESLRFLNSTGNLDLSNELVQKLTAEVMSPPSLGRTLDRPEYLGGKIGSAILEAVAIVEQAQRVSRDLCDFSQNRYSSFCNFNEEKFEISEFRTRLEKAFSNLYVNTPKNKEGQRLLSAAYDLMLKIENNELQRLLNLAAFSSGILETKTQNMKLDFLLLKENSNGISETERSWVRNIVETIKD